MALASCAAGGCQPCLLSAPGALRESISSCSTPAPLENVGSDCTVPGTKVRSGCGCVVQEITSSLCQKPLRGAMCWAPGPKPDRAAALAEEGGDQGCSDPEGGKPGPEVPCPHPTHLSARCLCCPCQSVCPPQCRQWVRPSRVGAGPHLGRARSSSSQM